MPKKKLLSVVIPVYNEESGIEKFHSTLLIPELLKLPYNFEVIYVNDGSRDRSLDILSNIAKDVSFVKIVNLSRNFGKELATTAGISFATGEATVIMDSDGQHPPALLSSFINKWEGGAQVVVGIRGKNEKEGLVKKYGSKLFYKVFNLVSSSKIIPRSTDYRLIDKAVRLEFVKFTERNRITRGLIDWLGFKREYVEFSSPARIAGEASYSTSQLFKLALNSFVSLTLKPLFFFGWIGLIIMVASILLGSFIIIEQFILHDPLGLRITGTAMLGVFISFLISLVLMSQAMIAVYMSHIYDQSQNRPLFIVDEHNSINLNKL